MLNKPIAGKCGSKLEQFANLTLGGIAQFASVKENKEAVDNVVRVRYVDMRCSC